jgi:hypothetical protein
MHVYGRRVGSFLLLLGMSRYPWMGVLASILPSFKLRPARLRGLV